MEIIINYHNENRKVKKRNLKALFHILEDLGYKWYSGLEITVDDMTEQQLYRFKYCMSNYKEAIKVSTETKIIVFENTRSKIHYDLNKNNIKEIISALK